jgi:hypothetical protein
MGWDEREDRNRIPCIVDEGIIANRRDMVRVLRDLGHVRYADMVGEDVRAAGEGIVSHVFSHEAAATIVANKRLYLNVNGFDFLRLGKAEEGGPTFDLVFEGRTLRLEPQSDPLADGVRMEEATYVSAEALNGLIGAQLTEEDLAELFQDDEADD